MVLRVNRFGAFVMRGLKSSRAHGALIGTGLSSLSNFLISIAVARTGTVGEVAMFAVGFAAFLAITGITRAMISEPSAARLLDHEDLRHGGRSIAFYGLMFGLLLAVVGLIMDHPYLVAAGVAGYGLALYDYAKFISLAFGRPSISVIMEAIRLLLLVTVILWPMRLSDPLWIFSTWLALTALTGLAGSLAQRIHLRPWPRNEHVAWSVSASYGMDYLLGSGSTQVTTFLLGAVAQPAVNASVRGSGTLLGPITVVANSVRALIIPFLSRRHRSGHSLTPSVHLTMLLVLFSLPLVVGVNLIPDSWGIFLLGETWTLTKVVLPLLSLELVFALVSNVPFAGHRSLGAHRRTLALRSILAPLRVATIVMTALVTGYVGAAVAMLATSAVSALVWWWSYRQLVRGNFSERGLSLTR